MFLVLVGNLHARTTPGTPWDAAFVPMGSYLVQAVPNLVSLNAAHEGGHAWACMGPKPSDCGEHPFGGEAGNGSPRVQLSAAPSKEGFSGVFHVGGRISASLPVRGK
jgi:hypothetical protein